MACNCEKSGEVLERQITVFTDCASKCVVLRLPYELAVMMTKECPPTQLRDELLLKMRREAVRSSCFRNMLIEAGLEKENA